ncbi:MAG: carboxypeptidase regulatory-like domain-containing protein [Acidobacteria bacterium]|nr:carboxypeptidase regulatory-like domain-containing protein [Acidobacteriota bacterium]
MPEDVNVSISRFPMMLLLCVAAYSQTSTGAISGTLVDSSGQALSGAEVTVSSQRTGETRSATTGDTGDFVFPALVPGPYTLKANAKGFRPLERTNINVTPSARLALGTVQLEIGTVTESIVVQASGATVQTGNSENGAILDSKQLEMVSIRGRDPISMLRILPGVTQGFDNEFAGGFFGTRVPNFQGLQNNTTTIMSDGVNGGDGGAGGVFSATVNIDAVQEVKVQLSNYTAEYGRAGGAQINIITKSGSREFHGSGYWFKRHEMFNANAFFRNRDGIAKQIYRFETLGGTIGGPMKLKVPVINPGGDKVFFFYSHDNTRIREPVAIERWRFPTALERRGDFTQSRDLNNRDIPVTDPLSQAPFPGRVIPASRGNPFGIAMMNIFPQPNFNDTGFNFLYQEGSLGRPRNQHLFRIDLQPTAKNSISVRGSAWFADTVGHHVAGGSSPWGLVRHHYTFTSRQLNANYTRIITPNLVNEMFAGFFISTEDGRLPNDDELRLIQRQHRGLARLGQFVPQYNPLNIIPRATFGGVPSTFAVAAINYDGRLPLWGSDSNLTITNNLTYTKGTHTFKFGGYRESSRFGQARSGTFGGAFDFGQDVNDPLNTGYAFANAFTGHFRQYTESLGRPAQFSRRNIWAWFAQDTWKVKPGLIVDIGMRWYWAPWPLQSNGEGSAFSIERYDPRRRATLFRPISTPQGRRAVNPLNGAILPQTFIGAIVPGTGDVCTIITTAEPCRLNGVVVQNDKSYISYGGFRDLLPIQWDPRLGIAWDPFKNGKTAIRASIGTFHQASMGGTGAFDGGPAFRFDKIILFSDMNQFLDAGSLTTPPNVAGPYRKQKAPLVYQYLFGIQHEVLRGTVLDVSYSGNTTRHIQQNWNFNYIPYGTRFLPQNADPTSTANPRLPLPDILLRPNPGYGDMLQSGPATSARYDSLQVQLNRRFIGGVEVSSSYTYSKSILNGWAQELNSRLRRTLLPNDQTHVLNMSFVVDIPKMSRFVPGRFSRMALDNWQMSSITTFASGFPQNVVLQTTDNFDFAGGGEGNGVVQTGRAILPRGERNSFRMFNTSVFKRPSGRGDLGTDFSNVKYRGPGFNNFDVSVFKNFPVFSEKRIIQFRWEFYNLFNHTQFSDVNNIARFDPAGNQVNTQFGWATAARSERRMQASLRFSF